MRDLTAHAGLHAAFHCLYIFFSPSILSGYLHPNLQLPQQVLKEVFKPSPTYNASRVEPKPWGMVDDSESTDDGYDYRTARRRRRRRASLPRLGNTFGQDRKRHPDTQGSQYSPRLVDIKDFGDMSDDDQCATSRARPGRNPGYTSRTKPCDDIYDADEDSDSQNIEGRGFDRCPRRPGPRAFDVGNGYERGNSYNGNDPLLGARCGTGGLGRGPLLDERPVSSRDSNGFVSHRRPRRRHLAAVFDGDDDNVFQLQRSRLRRRLRRQGSGWVGKAVLLMVMCGGSIAIAGTAVILILLLHFGRTLYAEDLMDWIDDCVDLISEDR